MIYIVLSIGAGSIGTLIDYHQYGWAATVSFVFLWVIIDDAVNKIRGKNK